MRYRFGALLVVLALTVSAFVTTSVGAVESLEDTPKMEYGVMPRWEFQSGRFNDAVSFECTVRVLGWAKEVGVSGVQRIRIHYEMYGAYAPLALPAERSSNEVAYPRESGAEFPDDSRSYWLGALMPWGLWFANGGERLIMDAVGERPSFWKPDIHEEIEMGVFSCPLDVPQPGGPVEVEPDEVTGAGGAHGVNDRDQDGIEDSIDPDSGCPGSLGGIDPVSGKRICIGRGGR